MIYDLMSSGFAFIGSLPYFGSMDSVVLLVISSL